MGRPKPDIITIEAYNDLKRVVAERLAFHAKEELAVRHYNRAARLLWPSCSDELKSKLVLR